MPRYYRGRRRFGRGPKVAVTQSLCTTKRKTKCRHCGAHIAAGETVTRLRLKKSFQMPCTGCGHKPAKVKYFHTACVPADINKAMGYDPAMHTAHTAPTAAVPPPPKPKSSADLKVEAILSIEAALAAGLRDRSVAKTPEVDKELVKINALKQRIIRPGTPAEGDTAANVTLKRLIDLVFGGRS